MRPRQAQSFGNTGYENGFDSFRAPHAAEREAAYAFHGAHRDPVHPPHPGFGVYPPPPFGPGSQAWTHGGYPGVQAMSSRGRYPREQEWGPTVDRYAGYSDSNYGEQRIIDELRAREGGDHVYRPHRGPHYGKGPKGYQRADEHIKDEICERLARDGFIDASGVEVAVGNGTVRLSGTIREPEDQRAIERVVRDVFGVREVRLELRLEQEGERPSEGADQNGRR